MGKSKTKVLCLFMVQIVLLTVSADTSSDDEFKNGKYTSGQVHGDHKYHHILVEPKDEKVRSGNRHQHQHFDWFTSSRGKGCYRLVRTGTRIAHQFIEKVLTTSDRAECEQECARANSFLCRGFNFKHRSQSDSRQDNNCELSLQDTYGADLDDTRTFYIDGQFDFYERTKIGRDCSGRVLPNSAYDEQRITTTPSSTGLNNQDLRDSWKQQTRPGWSTPSTVPSPGRWPSADFGRKREPTSAPAQENFGSPTPAHNQNPARPQESTQIPAARNTTSGGPSQTITSNTHINTHINEIVHHQKTPFVSKPVMQGSSGNSVIEFGNQNTGKPLPSLTATIDASATINTNVNTDHTNPVHPNNQIITSNTNTFSTNNAVIRPGTASSTFQANSNTFITRQPISNRNNNRGLPNRNTFAPLTDPRKPISRGAMSRFGEGFSSTSNVAPPPSIQFHRIQNDRTSGNRRNPTDNNSNRKQHFIINSNERDNERRNEDEDSDKRNQLFISPTQHRPGSDRFESVVFHRVTDAPLKPDTSVIRTSSSSTRTSPTGTRTVNTNVKTSTTNTANKNNNRQYWVTPDNDEDDKYSWISPSVFSPLRGKPDSVGSRKPFSNSNNNAQSFDNFKRVSSNAHKVDNARKVENPIGVDNNKRFGNAQNVDTSLGFAPNTQNAPDSSSLGVDQTNVNQPSDYYASFFNSAVRPLTGTFSGTFTASSVPVNADNQIGSGNKVRNQDVDSTLQRPSNINDYGSGGVYISNDASVGFVRVNSGSSSHSGTITTAKPDCSRRCQDSRRNQGQKPTFLPVNVNFPDIAYSLPRNKTQASRPPKPLTPSRPPKPFRPNRPLRPTRPPQFQISFLTTTPSLFIEPTTSRPSFHFNRFKPFQSPSKPENDLIPPATNIISNNNIDSFGGGVKHPSSITKVNLTDSNNNANSGHHNNGGFSDFFSNHINSHFGSGGSFGSTTGFSGAPSATSTDPDNNLNTGFGASTFGDSLSAVGVDNGGSFGIGSRPSPSPGRRPFGTSAHRPFATQSTASRPFDSSSTSFGSGSSSSFDSGASNPFGSGASSSFGSGASNSLGSGASSSFGSGASSSFGSEASSSFGSGASRPFGGSHISTDLFNTKPTSAASFDRKPIDFSSFGNRPTDFSPVDNSISSFGDGIDNSVGGFGQNNNQGSFFRAECFRMGREDTRMLLRVVRRKIRTYDLKECKKKCFDMTTFVCRSIAFRFRGNSWHSENCYLSDRDVTNFSPLDTQDDDQYDIFQRDFLGRECTSAFDGGLSAAQIDVVGGSETVSGMSCYGNSRCREDHIGGYWYCETNAHGAWDYCCRPDQTCSASSGSRLKWCYVGSLGLDQWRPCNNGFSRDFLLEASASNSTNSSVSSPTKVGGSGAAVLASLGNLNKNHHRGHPNSVSADGSRTKTSPSFAAGRPHHTGSRNRQPTTQNGSGSRGSTTGSRNNQRKTARPRPTSSNFGRGPGTSVPGVNDRSGDDGSSGQDDMTAAPVTPGTDDLPLTTNPDEVTTFGDLQSSQLRSHGFRPELSKLYPDASGPRLTEDARNRRFQFDRRS